MGDYFSSFLPKISYFYFTCLLTILVFLGTSKSVQVNITTNQLWNLLDAPIKKLHKVNSWFKLYFWNTWTSMTRSISNYY